MITLGIVANPAEINRTLTGFGNVPNDFELSRGNWYQSVGHGWIVGQDAAGQQVIYPDGSLGNGRLALANGSWEPAQIESLIAAEETKARMAIISAVGMAVVAALAVVGFARG